MKKTPAQADAFCSSVNGQRTIPGRRVCCFLAACLFILPLLKCNYPTDLPASSPPPESIRILGVATDLTVADSLVSRGMPLNALDLYRKVNASLASSTQITEEDRSWLRLKIAGALMQSDQPGPALSVLDSILIRTPDSPWALVASVEKGAMAQVEGRYSDALTLFLKGAGKDYDAVDGRTAFRIAYCYQQTKKWDEAVVWYDRARKRLSTLEDYALYYSAQCLFKLNRDAEGVSRLRDMKRKYPHSLFRLIPDDDFWETLLAEGRYDEVMEEARRGLNDEHVPTREEHAELLSYIGAAHSRAGRPDSARAVYHIMLENFRSAPAAQNVVEEFIRLSGQGSRLSGAEQLWIGQVYLDQRQYGPATGQFQALIDRPDAKELVPDALYYINRIRYLQKSYALAEKGFRQIVTRYPHHPVAGAASFHIARCIRARRGVALSLKAYQDFAEAYPEDENAPDALLFLGEQRMEAGKYTEAARHFRRLYEKYPGYSKRMDAGWMEGYCHYKLKAYDAASKVFRDMSRHDPASGYAPKGLYWSGNASQKAGRTDDARAAYQEVIEKYPASYFAYRAGDQLDKMGTSVGMPRLTGWKRGASSTSANDPREFDIITLSGALERLDGENSVERDRIHLERAEALFGAGLREQGEAELEHYREANSQSVTAHVRVARLYYAYRHYREGIRTAGRLQDILRSKGHSDQDIWPFLYPAPFWQTVVDRANERNLDPLFVLAVMRQESRFDHWIKSWADAHGLMQLMPVTARSLAKQHGIQGYAQKRLLEPELNITLGTHYLVELLRRFDGRLELTLAGYNGGPSRVSRWMRERGSSDIDEFVEEISISETRNFVKAVMNNYAQYVTRSTLSSTRVVE